GPPDIRPGSVPFDVRNDRPIGHIEPAARAGNSLPVGRHHDIFELRHGREGMETSGKRQSGVSQSHRLSQASPKVGHSPRSRYTYPMRDDSAVLAVVRLGVAAVLALSLAQGCKKQSSQSIAPPPAPAPVTPPAPPGVPPQPPG